MHAALLAGLAGLALEREPADPPLGLQVVWIEAGPAGAAAASKGDGGLADPPDSDTTAPPVLEHTAVLTPPNDEPAPAHLEALDPMSAADRPAPAPGETLAPAPDLVESADRQAPVGDRHQHEGSEPDDAPTLQASAAPSSDQAPAEPSRSEIDPAAPPEPMPPEIAAAEADLETESEHVADSEMLPEPDPGQVDVDLEQPLERTAELVPGQRSQALDTAAIPRERSPSPERLPASSPSQPLAAAERERIRDDVLDWLNRARDLASRPSTAWSRGGRDYRAELIRAPAVGATGIEHALVEITTTADGQQLSTEMHLKRLAFSHFAQLIDRWDPYVQIHDDVIDGRFHSNSEILVENSGGIQPVFHGMVTTAGGIDTSRSTRRVRRNEVFLGGLETRAPRIVLPRRFTPPELDALDADDADDARIVTLARDARITFAADGGFVLDVDGEAPTRGRLSPGPMYFVAAGKTTVGVRGTVNGKVLVYSPRAIVIEGHLVYAADPLQHADSDDYLGLVSDGSIDIAREEITGPGDLTVHAALYAKGRFSVSRFSRGDRATLTIYGSLTAGSLTATEPRYRTRLVFDPRLEDARPPSFPMTERYELASWDGAWRALARDSSL